MKSKRNKPLVFTELESEEPLELGQPAETAEEVAARAADERANAVGPSHNPSRDPFDPEAESPLFASHAAHEHPSRARAADDLGFARHAYSIAVLAAFVWAGALIAFVAGFQTHFGAFDYTPLQWVVIGLLAGLPALFIVLAAAAMRQGARLAAETRRARALADDLAIPAALAADQTGGAMEAMRREIERATEAARSARGPILSLRETLSAESKRLSDAALEAQETGRILAELLGHERMALGELSESMQVQAAAAAEALARQARVVADASDLAQAQLDEAQAALTARAADLAVAAGDARHAADKAESTLTGQIEQLTSAGVSLGDRVHALSEGLGREREILSGLSESFRADHDDLAVQIESQRALLSTAAQEAREGASALAAASAQGSDSLRGLIAAAAEEVSRLAEAAQREQAALDAQARSALSLFSGTVAEERAAIEAQTRAALDDLAAAAHEAREAASAHVETAADAARAHTESARAGLDRLASEVSAQIDSLGEAAFAAAQQADQAFEVRISSARRLIEESASLVEDAGERSARRIEAGVAGARDALAEMEALLAQVGEQMDHLPEEARRQAAAVREAIDRGVTDLADAARRAAEETQIIDATFQERVRRNYEILSDAVRMMGRVAGAADAMKLTPAAPAAPVAAPVIKPAAPVIKPAANGASRFEPEPLREPLREPVREAMPELRAAASGDRAIRVSLSDTTAATARLGGATSDVVRPAALSDPYAADPAPRRIDTVTAAGAGLRPRLKLTPAPIDGPPPPVHAPESPPPAAPPPAPPPRAQAEPAGASGDEWTWRELLSSAEEPAADDDALADRLIGEIEALGVDAAALLPRPRIDEIAAVLQAGDAGGAREVVRRLAPAAVRRLSRRVLTDKVLRVQADRYVRRYEELLADAARRDRQGYMTAALLGSEPGRAFLLLDAAVGDLH